MTDFSEGRGRVGMVAALEREVGYLVRGWRENIREHEGRVFKFYEDGDAVVVCGGIGAEAARRAAEALVFFYAPACLQSVGFAGALVLRLKVGALVMPERVVDARDNSSTMIDGGEGTLITFPAVATAAQKAKLARVYNAQVVDMEAAAVAQVARIHGILFSAIKVISDEAGFDLPLVDCVSEQGQFRMGKFLFSVAFRPWLWPKVLQLARNSGHASRALCAELLRRYGKPQKLHNLNAELHPTYRATP